MEFILYFEILLRNLLWKHYKSNILRIAGPILQCLVPYTCSKCSKDMHSKKCTFPSTGYYETGEIVYPHVPIHVERVHQPFLLLSKGNATDLYRTIWASMKYVLPRYKLDSMQHPSRSRMGKQKQQHLPNTIVCVTFEYHWLQLWMWFHSIRIISSVCSSFISANVNKFQIQFDVRIRRK